MTRRECGTCRFFEQSEIGETGSCRNQRCRDIVGLALVRRQELACRIGWDKDYYEALNANETIPGQSRPSADPRRQRSGYQGTRPDDIIVGVEQPRATSDPSLPPAARSRMSNVGEAHRRALERRQIAQQTGDPPPARRLSGAIPVSEFTPPERTDTQTSRARPITGDEGVSKPRLATPPLEPAPPAERLPAHLAITATLPVAPGDGVATDTAPTERRWSAPPGMQTAPAPFEPQRVLAHNGAGSGPPPARNEPNVAPFTATPPDGPPQNPLEAEWYQGERQRHRGKRCANCRDFQVAESGDRGWCRNRFAFPTPQLVGPNDLACLSCIGTWWAANDQWWLAKAPSPRQQPTPYADALLEEMQEEERRQAAVRRPGAG